MGIFLLLAVALVHGLIYVFLIPPWQHYDEPNHFEAAWLLANRNSLPRPGDYDQEMRRQVASSMIELGFFKDLGFLPDLTVKNQPIWIGVYSQLGDPPLYYLLASLPIRLFRFSNPYGHIESQLYSIRLFSLLLYLLTVWAAWGIMGESVRPGSYFRWLIPLSMALLPAFNDLMTSANNDVGAVAFFSLFLWAILRLMKRGFSWQRLLSAAAACLLCCLTKNTVWISLPLLAAGSLLAVLPGQWKWLVWGGAALACLGFVAFSLQWGDPAQWYRVSGQPIPAREKLTGAPNGSYAFRFEAKAALPQASLQQILPYWTVQKLSGKTVTLGAWMWADRPVKIRTPWLQMDGIPLSEQQQWTLGLAPAFYSIGIVLPQKLRNLMVVLPGQPVGSTQAVTIYADGLVLKEGGRPISAIAPRLGKDGAAGYWGELPFVNLIRNPSAESSWLFILPWADQLGMKLIPDHGRPSLVLYSILDREGAGWYYWVTSQSLIRTFWAKFGWGNVPLLGHKPYRVLFLATLAGLLGWAVFLWKIRRTAPWHLVLFCALATTGIWGLALVRGSVYLAWTPYIPVARYAYPAVIPTLAALVAGWGSWIPKRYRSFGQLLIPAGLAILAVYSLYSIWMFYNA